jgi:hypothetical protein
LIFQSLAMSGKIFINYRRGDDPGFTGRLFDRLEAAFTTDQLFMDIDSIEPGLDFVRVLEDQVDRCDIFLAVIGPNWLDAQDDEGSRRLDNDHDFVRIEIESGLKLGKRIIPVLVNNADMPRAEHLPESLKPLARRNAVRLTHERFKADASGLVKQLEKALQDVEAARQAATSAAAAEAKRREADEAAKAAELERQEKARQVKTVAGLSAEQITKAEELANWDFIKESESPQDFRDHLARFPKGVTDRMARAKLESLVWSGLGEAPGLDEIEAFLAEFPDGKHTVKAKGQRDALKAVADAASAEQDRDRRETEAWAAASSADTAEAYEAFIEKWPDSQHSRAARTRLKQLAASTLQDRGSRMLSLVFVAAVLPCQLLLGALFDAQGCNIREPGCVEWADRSIDPIVGFVKGAIVALLIALSSAGALAFRQRAVLTDADIFRYWLGCTLAFVVALATLFRGEGWSWMGAPSIVTGALVATTIAIFLGAALFLVFGAPSKKKGSLSSGSRVE